METLNIIIHENYGNNEASYEVVHTDHIPFSVSKSDDYVQQIPPQKSDDYVQQIPPRESDDYVQQIPPRESDDCVQQIPSWKSDDYVQQIPPRKSDDYVQQIPPRESDDYVQQIPPRESNDCIQQIPSIRAASKTKAIIIQKAFLPTLVAVVLILVVLIFQIPAILYYTDPPLIDNLPLEGVNLEACTVDKEMFQYSNITLVGMCEQSKLCNFTYSVPPEFYALQTVYNVSSETGNGLCGEVILSLFCNATAVYDGCNVTTSLDEECLKVRDNECAAEWRIVETLFNRTLLDCDSLNNTENISLSRATNQTCPNDFGVLCGSICQPLCAEISFYDDATTTAYTVFNILFQCTSMLTGLITIVASIYDRKKMFTFPLIFVVYNTISTSIIGFFLVLPYIFGIDRLLCAHPSLIVANEKPTDFCKIQGIVVHSGALVWCGLWLFHLFHMFYSILFPFKAQRLMTSTRFKRSAHIIELLIVLISGFTPSIVIVNTTGYRYSGFPPACYSDNPAVQFYTLILPMALGSTVGCSMLFLSVWILRKNRNIQDTSQATVTCINCSTSQTKLMILFAYYCVTVVLLLISFTFISHSFDSSSKNITSFTLCSAGGYREECDKFRDALHNSLVSSIVVDLVATAFVGFANGVNLLYVLQFQDVKKAFKKLFSFNSA